MSFKLTFELSDRDLRHFQRELRRARESVSIADDEEILAAAADMVAKLRATEPPDFIGERLAKLETLQTMLGDADWPLAKDERNPVLAALAYVCDPEDIIPDSIPGIGLLDDAIMIELVLRDLRHTIESYADFCAYRRILPKRLPGRRDPATMAHMLEQRREQLMERMRRRRKADQR